jgi:hypothetical protein
MPGFLAKARRTRDSLRNSGGPGVTKQSAAALQKRQSRGEARHYKLTKGKEKQGVSDGVCTSCSPQ